MAAAIYVASTLRGELPTQHAVVAASIIIASAIGEEIRTEEAVAAATHVPLPLLQECERVLAEQLDGDIIL